MIELLKLNKKYISLWQVVEMFGYLVISQSCQLAKLLR